MLTHMVNTFSFNEFVKHSTCTCTPAAQGKEGVITELANTAAVDAHLLDLFDCSNICGPQAKGNNLVKIERIN